MTRRLLLREQEDPAPGAAHVLGIAVAVLDVSREGLDEERNHGVANAGVEHGGVDLQRAVDEPRQALLRGPGGQRAGGHFVEGQGRGEALGIVVPAPAARVADEGVQVDRGAGGDVVGADLRQGEIEQDQV